MDKLPKRSAPVYEEIENFKDYELTECIAYEMAIRNDENIENIKNFIKNFLAKDFIDNDYQPILEQKNFKASKIDSFKLTKNMINPFELYLNYPFFKDLNDFITNEKNKYIKEAKRRKEAFIKKYSHSDNINYDLDGKKFDDLFFNKKIYKKTDKLDTNNKTIYHRLIGNNFFNSYTRYIENNETKENTIMLAEITPKYSRPSLYIPFEINKNVKLNLNLALPLKDLEDFIIRIKKVFDNDNSITLSANEFIGNKLLVIDKDTKSILSNAKKMADAFYIYDCLKLNLRASEIKLNLSYYHHNRGNFDHDTYQKYKNVAINYIDKKKYKELIT